MVLVCPFNCLPKRKCSDLSIAAAFSINYFSVKTSLTVKNSYLLTFPDYKSEIIAVYLSTLY